MTDLQALLDAQHALQVVSFKKDPKTLEGDARVEFTTWNILALLDEAHEALAETGWKPWASSRHVNEDAMKGELVDLFHFFMNLCLTVGMDAAELEARYFAKRKVNAQRQEDGYDGVSTKCPGCGREYSDIGVECYAENPNNDRFCVEKGLGF